MLGMPLRYARQRKPSYVAQGDIHQLPFAPGFDLIGCFDVLEHLPDDTYVLQHIQTMLAPRGVLVLTVPAHPSLWSSFDEASHHCRRYELRELRARLVSSGYEVEYITHFMAGIFPLIWLHRRLKSHGRRSGGRDSTRMNDLAQAELRIVPLVNDILAWLLYQEARLVLGRRRLPVGTSLLAVARNSMVADGKSQHHASSDKTDMRQSEDTLESSLDSGV